MPQISVLVIDDDTSLLKIISMMLENAGMKVSTAANGIQAIETAIQKTFDVAVVDLSLPDMSGTDAIERLKAIDPDMQTIILTGNPSLDSSVKAIQQQVFDYLIKPADKDKLIHAIQRAVDHRRLIVKNRELVSQLDAERNQLKDEVAAARKVIERQIEDSERLVGQSELIKRIRRFVAQIAPSDITVLILGESGTGKDVVARLIHEASGRDPNAFVKINCPAIPDTLLESELFGHEQGAFTGAERRKPGRFELASGGTVFLDEIADLPISLQGKLLQAIEHKSFTRLGGRETLTVDTRILAATNAPIEDLVDKGRFRSDIYYRLNEFAITMPPLRHRKEDIPLLAHHFCQKFGGRYGSPDLQVSSSTLSRYMDHDWPGNVRELESAVRRIALEGQDNGSHSPGSVGRIQDARRSVSEVVQDTESQAILRALTETQWNRREATKMLKMSYSSLRRRIEKYGLKKM